MNFVTSVPRRDKKGYDIMDYGSNIILETVKTRYKADLMVREINLSRRPELKILPSTERGPRIKEIAQSKLITIWCAKRLMAQGQKGKYLKMMAGEIGCSEKHLGTKLTDLWVEI